MLTIFVALFFLRPIPTGPVLENDFVRVFRNHAPCASAAPACGERVFVALSNLELNSQKLERGDIRAFQATESYNAPSGGEYLEVIIKPGHPKPAALSAGSPPPPGNKVLYDGRDIIVFEERMEPGGYSPPHSHNQRVAIFLNKAQVQQWVEGKSEVRDEEPDAVIFRPAVVHASKNLSAIPVRNILIEFKP